MGYEVWGVGCGVDTSRRADEKNTKDTRQCLVPVSADDLNLLSTFSSPPPGAAVTPPPMPLPPLLLLLLLTVQAPPPSPPPAAEAEAEAEADPPTPPYNLLPEARRGLSKKG
ncbi:hypothetical protein M0802_012951 [Mischocyttarus mexicanus]|nr:hypothetical protein M0802_012951 [Mischocyttarus mexicanus]